jgi:tetratricopeptide (TPR) repeat protein
MARRDALVSWCLALVLVGAVFALYWPVRAHEFVSYDDEVYLTQNPHVLRGLVWDEVRWVFTHAHAANYHPLTWVSHMLDVEFLGLASGAHHLVNVALHALNGVLVLCLSRALLANIWAAGFAAALFALHPLRVESVAWASERKDVLCATFYLAAALFYLAYSRRPSPGRYALVVLATALALLAKPMAVSLPCAFLLLDFWPLERLGRGKDVTLRRLVLEKLPFFALSALGALSTWFAQEVGGAASTGVAVPLELRLWNALAATGTYLEQTIWPAHLAPFYPLAALVEEAPRAVLLGPALVTLTLLLGSGLGAWRWRARAPWFALALCWFLALLVPVLGLKQVGLQAHADRYTYLPLLGPAWILAGFGLALARRHPVLRTGLSALTLLALSLLAGRARDQVHVWRDTRTLFEHALAVTEKNHVAHSALAVEEFERGDHARARAHAEQALALYQLDPSALTTLARLELERGDPRAAEALLQRAKQVHASKWVRYFMGRVKLALGNQEAAAREFTAALELDPSLVDAHYNLGQVLYGLARKEEARTAFERALTLAPAHAGAHNGLGVLAFESGALELAEEHLRRATDSDPEYADAHHNLGLVLERRAKTEEAAQAFERARVLEQKRRR